VNNNSDRFLRLTCSFCIELWIRIPTPPWELFDVFLCMNDRDRDGNVIKGM